VVHINVVQIKMVHQKVVHPMRATIFRHFFTVGMLAVDREDLRNGGELRQKNATLLSE
jgi:hypothetical protein